MFLLKIVPIFHLFFIELAEVQSVTPAPPAPVGTKKVDEKAFFDVRQFHTGFALFLNKSFYFMFSLRLAVVHTISMQSMRVWHKSGLRKFKRAYSKFDTVNFFNKKKGRLTTEEII